MAKLNKKKKLLFGSANLMYVAIGVIAVCAMAYFVMEYIVMG